MTDRTWYLIAAGVIIAAVVFGFAVGAYGQEIVPQGVDLPIETIYRGQPGDINPVATIPAEPGLQCVAVLESRNNESEHPNSDILVGPVTFTNVETASFQAAALTFISTGPIDVAVRLGGDGVFSAGFTLEVTCNPPTTTTPSPSTTRSTTPSSSTTSTSVVDSVPPTTSPLAPPTTLSPPPVGGVDTGYGSCANGACDGFSLSPLATWTLYITAWLLASIGLSTFIAIVNRKESGE